MKDDTLAIHGGFGSGSYAGSSAVPVFQTVAFAHGTAQQLADVFAHRAPGYIYTRIANPTTTALEVRFTDLEDGIGSVATSSGMAAISAVATALLKAGDEIVAASGIFGGTVSLFDSTLSRFDITTRYVDAANTAEVADAVSEKTRFIFIETIGNPKMDVPDIAAIADIAHDAGIPLIVDNTLATPVLCKPGRFGADIVVHSTSKFINGHGTAIGGAIVDIGSYKWADSPFEQISKLATMTGQLAFLSNLRNTVYRDLGGCPAPLNSFLMLQGLQTLSPRMDKHCSNAHSLAEFLAGESNVKWVNYPGLKSSEFHGAAARFLGGRGGSLLTFALADKSAAFRFIDALKLAKNMANLGDAKTLVIHPASTIFHEFESEDLAGMGVSDDMIRVSVGIEDFEDIKNDFHQALKKAVEEQT